MDSKSGAADPAELFRKLAQGYDDAIRRYQPTYDAMRRVSTDLASVATSGRERCLDFGSGTGGALPLLSPLFDEVIAIDPGKAMLDLAIARTKAEGTARGGARHTFIHGSIDVPEAAALEDDSHRGASADFVAAAEAQVHAAMHRLTPETLISLLEETGFKNIERPYQALHTHVFVATK